MGVTDTNIEGDNNTEKCLNGKMSRIDTLGYQYKLINCFQNTLYYLIMLFNNIL